MVGSVVVPVDAGSIVRAVAYVAVAVVLVVSVAVALDDAVACAVATEWWRALL